MIRSTKKQSLGATLRQAGAVASEMVEETIASSRRMGTQLDALVSALQPTAGTFSRRATPCCPPEVVCPPECLITIARRAHAGEVVLVPFKVRNTTSKARQYKVGVRPLKDEHGNAAPSQPTVDKTNLQLEPHESTLVEMRLDLSQGYKAGQNFSTDVVVRENKYNQNICFTLHVEPYVNVPTAEPIDEARLDVHFVSWDKHFFCEPRRGRGDVSIRPDRPQKASKREEKKG